MEMNDKLREQLGGWANYLQPFVESAAWDKIFAELKSRKGRGIKTYPASTDVFRAFATCSPDNLKVILYGMAPYHTETKEGVIIADGLAFSCSKTGIPQPSLNQLYGDMEMVYANGLDVDMIQETDLGYLPAQGVMLLNAGLTCQAMKAGSDNQLWEPLMRFFWEEVINKYFRGIPIVLMGTEAQKHEKYIQPMLHYIIKTTHPASASYQGNGVQWCSDGLWKKLDQLLEENYKTHIKWYLLRGDELITDKLIRK